MMAFSGVLSSWLMLARNSVLALLAASARSLAVRSAASRALISVMSDQIATKPPSRVTLCTTRTQPPRSEEHTSELQSLMRISYAVFCLKKTKQRTCNLYPTDEVMIIQQV